MSSYISIYTVIYRCSRQKYSIKLQCRKERTKKHNTTNVFKKVDKNKVKTLFTVGND